MLFSGGVDNCFPDWLSIYASRFDTKEIKHKKVYKMVCSDKIFSGDNLFFFPYSESYKGQMISKGLLVSSNSPKKRTNEFVFITTTNSFVRFLGESEANIKSFWTNLTFKHANKSVQLWGLLELIMQNPTWNFAK